MNDIDAILKATDGHTPGPWVVNLNFDNVVDSIGPIEAGAEFAAHWWLITGGPENAALVSAAPALRAEVLRLRSQLSGRTMHCAGCEAMAREVEALRERDAAWEWLVGVWGYSNSKHARGVYKIGDAYFAAQLSHETFEWDDVANAPDPVALARALGRKDGE